MPSRREGPPDPFGKRALFWVPEPAPDLGGAGAEGAIPLGKRALYSGSRPEPAEAAFVAEDAAGAATGGVGEGGTFVVRCQRCGEVSPVGLLELLRSQFPVGIWLPRGRFDRRMRCPACHRRSWCSVTMRHG